MAGARDGDLYRTTGPASVSSAPGEGGSAPPSETCAEWARRRQREKEAALDAEGRILLALRLGQRALALRRLVRP
jgi:hypothetical protein